MAKLLCPLGVKEVYLSSVEGSSRRGMPLGRWEDRVKECLSERGYGLERAKREFIDKERWRSFCRGHPLEREIGPID